MCSIMSNCGKQVYPAGHSVSGGASIVLDAPAVTTTPTVATHNCMLHCEVKLHHTGSVPPKMELINLEPRTWSGDLCAELSARCEAVSHHPVTPCVCIAAGGMETRDGNETPLVLGPRYDQLTQLGRFKHFFDMADPRCLLPSIFFGMSLDEATAELIAAKARLGSRPQTTQVSDRVWLANKIYTSAVHPDTREIIPQPFRMSGFAVYGNPIVVGMLLPNPTGSIAQTVFWQWANQSHNACVNYANRNASSATAISDLALGYTSAVGTSVIIALGLGQALSRSALSQATKAALSRFIAYPSVASANIANLVLMRFTELSAGIHVKDAEGKVRGTSQAAAKQAIFDTAVTRVVLPMPLLLLPAVGMNLVEKYTPLFQRRPSLRIPVNACFCMAAFIVGLPFALSLFPQEGDVAAQSLENKFHNLVDSQGKSVTRLYYNKGL